jgi:hypothetical protein
MGEMSKVEEVARALSIADGMHPDAESNDEDSTPAWTLYVESAKAAFAAMREPTLAMRQAGAFRGRFIDLGNGRTAEGMALGDHPITSYTKMIDEALKE